MPIIANVCWIYCSNIRKHERNTKHELTYDRNLPEKPQIGGICSHETRGRSYSAPRHSEGLDEKIPSCSAWKHGKRRISGKTCLKHSVTSVSHNLCFDISWSLDLIYWVSADSANHLKLGAKLVASTSSFTGALEAKASHQTWQRPQQPTFIWVQYFN